MRDDGDDLAGVGFTDLFCCFAERAAGVGHVVDEDGGLVFHFAGQGHAGDDAGLGALFAGLGVSIV